MIPAHLIRTPAIRRKRAEIAEKRLELNHLAHYRTGGELTQEERSVALRKLRQELTLLEQQLSSLIGRERYRMFGL